MTQKYNLGFFGLSGSGKTCILAALDMQRVAHPLGYTGSLLPLEDKRPTGVPDTWNAEEKRADVQYKSSDRLEEAKQQLKHGNVPESTELSIDFLFDYKFSSAKTGEFYVRLTDYGGELVNPNNAPQEIAKELRKKLEGMDGLLVLAPAPFPDEAKKGVSEKLQRLQKTMGLFQFRKPIPIVLLITKGDRIAPLSEYTVAQQPLTKEDFPTTEHLDLYHDLVNKVGKENCKAFLASAFGECERCTTEDGKETELPKKVNPLTPFGLLEGFIWLAQRLEVIQSQRNVLQLQHYEQLVANYKKWRPYPSLSLWQLQNRGKEIIDKFPRDSEMAQHAIHAQHQCAKTWWNRLMVLVVLIIIIPLVTLSGKQAYDDKKRYDYVQSTLNAPNAELEEIVNAERWLESYGYTSPFLHSLSWLLVVSKGTAKSKLEQSRHRREKQLWQTIQEAPSIKKKIQAANTYLKVLPNSKRIGEVKIILAKSEEILRQTIEQQWWQPVEQAPSVTAKFEAARAYLKALPDGQHKAENRSIITQIEQALRQEQEQRLWLPVEQAKSKLVKLEAARLYQKNLPDGKHQAEIKTIIVEIEEALRKEEEQRFWQLVLDANSPRLKKAAAQAYLQEKPNGQHVAEAKQVIAQAEETLQEEKTALREEKEERLWLPVEQANILNIKEKLAKDYLAAIPDGKHAAIAYSIIAEYQSQQEATIQKEYYELFNEYQFSEAAQHLSQHQQLQGSLLQELKQHFLANVFDLLEQQTEKFIKQAKWQDAYKQLDNYRKWPEEFQDIIQKTNIIRALRIKVEKAEDRYLYTQLLEHRDIERAENYLRFKPELTKQTMQEEVKNYKQYLNNKKNPLELLLILERIEWGNFNESDNIVTVFLDGKKIIEAVGIEAKANNSTGEIGRENFTRTLSDSVKIKIKIIEENWLSGYDNNGQNSKNCQVEELNGLTLDLYPPDHSFINKAIFRLEGIPTEPLLPDWREE